jgi:hypothetical protein
MHALTVTSREVPYVNSTLQGGVGTGEVGLRWVEA